MSLPDADRLASFAFVSLMMVCTPGPNMIYLVSRSLSQGVAAGLLSLVGVASAFFVLLLSAVLGITALLLALPFALTAIRLLGAGYLLWLAWQALRPRRAGFSGIALLGDDPPVKLVRMGFATNILNPKALILYLSLLPQFIDPQKNIFSQSLALGFTQIAISVAVNMIIIIAAGKASALLRRETRWNSLPRYITAVVLCALAAGMMIEVASSVAHAA